MSENKGGIRMELNVLNISREYDKFYGDVSPIFVSVKKRYEIDFIFKAGGSFVESQVTIAYDGDLSFEKAEELIREKLVDNK